MPEKSFPVSNCFNLFVHRDDLRYRCSCLLKHLLPSAKHCAELPLASHQGICPQCVAIAVICQVINCLIIVEATLHCSVLPLFCTAFCKVNIIWMLVIKDAKVLTLKIQTVIKARRNRTVGDINKRWATHTATNSIFVKIKASLCSKNCFSLLVTHCWEDLQEFALFESLKSSNKILKWVQWKRFSFNTTKWAHFRLKMISCTEQQTIFFKTLH